MDIHRCRFVPYPPSTINALAFSQSEASRGKKATNLRLAIGRANGDIEIWNPMNGAWLQEIVLRGGEDRSVDGLVWIQDPDEEIDGKTVLGRLRLFSTGYTTTVTEWDLEKGQPLRQSSGNHGEIWCLAAQPSIPSPQNDSTEVPDLSQWGGQNLVTGCTDGAVVLYSTEDQDLQFRKILVRPSAKKAKVISIVFQNRNIVIAGCTDSMIRIFDIRSGGLVRSMSLGAGPVGGPKEIIVWAVKCLRNGTIISGDSTGEIRIWDGKTYTLVQRIKSHKQDVLSLATSMDGSMILSGGMDRRTVAYKQVGGARSRWAEVTHRRFHSHDVKTMATFESSGMSIAVSGGPDANPIVIPLREFGMENHRTLPCLPQNPVIQSAPKRRLVMSWWDREVHIWRLSRSSRISRESADPESESGDRSPNQKLVAKVIVKGEANITSVSISTDGNLLAVSTAADIKVFRLKSRSSRGLDPLKITKLDVLPRLSTGGARLIQFSPDGHWLAVVRRDNRITISRVTYRENDLFKLHPILLNLGRIDRKLQKRILLGGLGTYDRSITRIAFSADSRILAVSDLAGYIDTWTLNGVESERQLVNDGAAEDDASLPSSSEDSDSDDDEEKTPIMVLGQHWTRHPSASLIPRLSSAAVVLSFRPASAPAGKIFSSTGTVAHATRNKSQSQTKTLPPSEDRLLVVTASGQFFEFETQRGTLSAWSRRNPTSNFPEQFKGVRDQAMGCVWDVNNSKERLWLYGSNWLWMFDLSRNLPCSFSALEPSTNGHVNGSLTAAEQSRPNKKRKFDSALTDAITHELRKGTSGAGSKIPDVELLTGISRKHQTLFHDSNGLIQQSTQDNHYHLRPSDLDMDMDEAEADVDDDDDDATAPPNLLQQLRRTEHGNDENGAPLLNGDVTTSTAHPNPSSTSSNAGPHFWHTFKYRPIMGIVALERESLNENGDDADAGTDMGTDMDVGLEVVLVERPAWEMELPPRYYGEGDLERERDGE